MGALFGSLSNALRSLLTQPGTLEASGQNIANVHAPGFSRQRPVPRQTGANFAGPEFSGSGVDPAKVESLRGRVLELRMYQETYQQGGLEVFLSAMKLVEAQFEEGGGAGLEFQLSEFFNSLGDLNANPSSIPLRQAALSAAQSLAEAFRSASRNLASLQDGLDQQVAAAVDDINQLAREIADLNRQSSTHSGTGKPEGSGAGELEGRRSALVRELASKMDLTVNEGGSNSLTLTTTSGTALVAGEKAEPLAAQVDPVTGFQHIFSRAAGGTDITDALTGGALGGLLRTRDAAISALLGDLDTLASSVAIAVNTAHHNGFDLKGAAGGDFFIPPPTTGAAAQLTVAITAPDEIAASSDGTQDHGANLQTILALRGQTIVAGQKPADFYAGVALKIRNDVSTAEAELEAQSLSLRQLQNQRDAVRAVSMDEEADSLLRYQRAFEAAARVVSAVAEFTQTAPSAGQP